MIYKVLDLIAERNVKLTLYLHENYEEFQHNVKKPMVVVCPGGGYSFLSKREAEPVAAKFFAAGFHAAVLEYGINEYALFPGPIKDAAYCMAYLKEHADEWCIDKDNVFISGFSAGGHVAASLGVFWNNENILPEYKDNFDRVKPKGMILGYPVIDLRATLANMDIGILPGTDINTIVFDQIHPNMPREKIFVKNDDTGEIRVNFEVAMNAFIFGGEYTDEQEDFYSLQNQVTKDTIPAFMWHAQGDGLIYPSNSLDFARKLFENNVPYELHIYQGGNHGVSLANYIAGNDSSQLFEEACGWIDLAIDWVLNVSGYKDTIKDYCSGKFRPKEDEFNIK